MPIRYTITYYTTLQVVAYHEIDAEGPEHAAVLARAYVDDGNAGALPWEVDGTPDIRPAAITFDVTDATSDEFLGTEADLGVCVDDYI